MSDRNASSGHAPAGSDADLALLHSALDGPLDAESGRRLGERLADPSFADAFARMLLLEEALRRECSSEALLSTLRRPPEPRAARAHAVDRSYRLSVLDERAADRSLDGALLHLGSRGQYVLLRHDRDGALVASGSDGTSAWIVPPQGAVRVSASPTRFRGRLPGQQFDLPFLDPSSGDPFVGGPALGLEELAEHYVLELRGVHRPGEEPRTVVEATRREGVRGGPKSVTIEVDPRSMRIERMRFDRLPQAKEGPRSVLLERIPSPERPERFFSHTAHHTSDRPVRFEP
jgi:hypothetical protein